MCCNWCYLRYEEKRRESTRILRLEEAKWSGRVAGVVGAHHARGLGIASSRGSPRPVPVWRAEFCQLITLLDEPPRGLQQFWRAGPEQRNLLKLTLFWISGVMVAILPIVLPHKSPTCRRLVILEAQYRSRLESTHHRNHHVPRHVTTHLDGWRRTEHRVLLGGRISYTSNLKTTPFTVRSWSPAAVPSLWSSTSRPQKRASAPTAEFHKLYYFLPFTGYDDGLLPARPRASSRSSCAGCGVSIHLLSGFPPLRRRRAYVLIAGGQRRSSSRAPLSRAHSADSSSRYAANLPRATTILRFPHQVRRDAQVVAQGDRRRPQATACRRLECVREPRRCHTMAPLTLWESCPYALRNFA